MSGVEIITHLLRASSELTKIAPAANIKGGALAEGERGILIRCVSQVDRQFLTQGPIVNSTARVSATIRAANYRDQLAAILLIRRACAGVDNATIGVASKISVRTAGLGPDVNGPGGTFEQAQDFRVTFDAPA